jgi:glycosyltransferase involved in cell wall biosynthesis
MRGTKPRVEGGLPEEFLLSLSASFWHKNRPHAIRVFAELCSNGYEGALVIAGPEPLYGRSLLLEDELLLTLPSNVAERVLRIGQIDEAAKWWLLDHAKLVLYPSVVEGFGMVPFEAASVGTPSLSYAGSGLLEVLGADSPALVPTWDVGKWATDALASLRSADHASAVVDAVNREADAHSWEIVAERTWDAIDATLARPNSRPRTEEGGYRSHVAPAPTLVTRSARTVHFGNRLFAYARRRLGRSEPLHHD